MMKSWRMFSLLLLSPFFQFSLIFSILFFLLFFSIFCQLSLYLSSVSGHRLALYLIAFTFLHLQRFPFFFPVFPSLSLQPSPLKSSFLHLLHQSTCVLLSCGGRGGGVRRSSTPSSISALPFLCLPFFLDGSPSAHHSPGAEIQFRSPSSAFRASGGSKGGRTPPYLCPPQIEGRGQVFPPCFHGVLSRGSSACWVCTTLLHIIKVVYSLWKPEVAQQMQTQLVSSPSRHDYLSDASRPAFIY